jgi:hypothetical protein
MEGETKQNEKQGQTMIYKTLQRKLKTDQYEQQCKLGVPQKGKQFLLH